MSFQRAFVCFISVVLLFQTSCRLGTEYEVQNPTTTTNQGGGTSSLTTLRAAVGIVMQGPSTAKIDGCRGPFTLEGRDADSNVGTMSPDNGAVQISGMLAGTEMYSDAGCSQRLTSQAMTVPTAGAAQMSFYVIPRTVGTANLVATQGAMNPARLTTVFTAGSPVSAHIVVSRNFAAFRCMPVSIALRDRLGNAANAESDLDFDLSITRLPSLEIYSNATCTTHTAASVVVTGNAQSATFYVYGSAPGDGTINAASGTSFPSAAPVDVTVVNSDSPKLAISVPAGNHRVHTCVPITILTQNSAGVTLPTRIATRVTVGDNSGTFALYGSGCTGAVIPEVTIADGSSQAVVYGFTNDAQTVGLTATAANYVTGSTTMPWIANVPKKIVFTGLSSGPQVGDLMPGTVKLLDEWDNDAKVDERTTIDIRKTATSVGDVKILAGSCTGSETAQLFININQGSAPFCLQFRRAGALHLDADSAPLIGANADFIISPSTGMPSVLVLDTVATAVAGECRAFSLLTVDQFGNPKPVTSIVAFNLSSRFSTATFYADGNPCRNPTTSLTIASGASSAYGYWADTKAGDDNTLTARSTTVLANPLSDSVDTTISAGAPKALFWIGVPQWTYAGVPVGPLSLLAKDQYGNEARVTTAFTAALSMGQVTDEQFTFNSPGFSPLITQVTFPVGTNRINGIFARTRTVATPELLATVPLDPAVGHAREEFDSRTLPATTLRLATADTTPNAGDCISVTVAMVDNAGNPLVADPVVVDLSSDSTDFVYRVGTTCTNPWTTPSVTLTNQVPMATVKVRTTTAGRLRLDGLVRGTTIADSLSLNWGFGSERRLNIEPTGPAWFLVTDAGGPYEVVRRDQFGNVVTATAAVQFDITSTPAGLDARASAAANAGNPVIGLNGRGTFYIRSNAVGDFTFVAAAAGALTSPLRRIQVRNLQPTIAAVNPDSGPVAGNTPINITGSNFAANSEVKIGGILCNNFQFVNSGSINCTTPPGTPGPKSVVVEPPFGASRTATNAFTYLAVAPRATAMSPSQGPHTGGTLVTIDGAGFVDDTAVAMGGSPCTGVRKISANQLTCTTTAHAAGVVNVTVTNPSSYTGTFLNAYTYYNAAPTISGNVSPGAGPNVVPATNRMSVTITGSNFRAGARVTLGGSLCIDPVINGNGTTITCKPGAYAGTGLVSVVVTNSDGTSATRANAFCYQGVSPTISGNVSPGAGPNVVPATNRISVTITGSNFRAGARVTLGGSLCIDPVVNGNGTTITCKPGAYAGTGLVSVVVTNSDGTSATRANAFCYQGVWPTISGNVSPGAGPNVVPATNRMSVTITGSNFRTGATVTLGGSPCIDPVVNGSGTAITCKPGAYAGTGLVSVVVTNSDGTSATRANAFTYVAAPVATNLTPTSGLLGVATRITLTGSHFTDSGSVPTVTVGGLACNRISYSATQIVCDVSAALTVGAKPVLVTTLGGSDNAGTFTVIQYPPPVVDLKYNGGNGPVSVPFTGTVRLTATTTNIVAGTCTVAGPGVQAYAGNGYLDINTAQIPHTAGVALARQTYTLNCLGLNGTRTADSLSIDFTKLLVGYFLVNNSAGPLTIPHNGLINLAWQTTNATSCLTYIDNTLVSQALTGNLPNQGPLSAGAHTVRQTCQGNGGPVTKSVAVTYSPTPWIWVWNDGRENCTVRCAANGGRAVSVDDRGNRCASGEARPQSVGPNFNFHEGCWSGRHNYTCYPLQNAENTYEKREGDGHGSHKHWHCYRPNQKEDDDVTDITVGCVCRR